MRALFAPLEKLTYADIGELVSEQAQENVRLEFTSAHESEFELLKKLSSFANTLGGRLFIGVEQGRQSIATAANGVERKDGFAAQVSASCLRELYPPLLVSVSPEIEVPNSPRKVYVIEVPESATAPHFVEGRRGCWVRSGDSSHRYVASLATAEEIGWLSGRRRKAEELRDQVEGRFEHRWRSYSGWWSAGGGIGFLVQTFIGPTHPARTRYRLQDLREAADKSLLATSTGASWRADEIHTQDGSIVMARDRTSTRRLLDFSECGFVGTSTALPVELRMNKSILTEMDAGTKYVAASQILGSLLLATRLAGRFHEWPASLTARFWLRNPEQHWIVGHQNTDGQFSFEAHPVFDQEMEFGISCQPPELVDESDTVALRAFKRMAFGLGWAFADDQRAADHLAVLKKDALAFLTNF